MRGSIHTFITHEVARRDRINMVWHPLRGKPGVLADWSSDTDGTQVIADPDIMLDGDSTVTAGMRASVEGGLWHAVAAGTVLSKVLQPHTLANNSGLHKVTWSTDQEVECEWLVLTDSEATPFGGRWFKCGLLLTDVIDNPDAAQGSDIDQVYFVLNNDEGNLDVGVSINNADAVVADVQVVLESQYLHLAIKFDRLGEASVYINGRRVELNGDFRGNAADLLPFCGTMEATAGDNPEVNLLGMAISRAIGA